MQVAGMNLYQFAVFQGVYLWHWYFDGGAIVGSSKVLVSRVAPHFIFELKAEGSFGLAMQVAGMNLFNIFFISLS